MSTAAPDSFPASSPVLPGDPDELRTVIDARRVHLATTLDELVERLSPKTLAADAKAEAVVRARAVVTDENGALRTERVAAIAAAVVALLGLFVTGRVRASKRRRARRARRAARDDV